VPTEDVLKGIIQGMAHMERSGYIRRRDDNAERFLSRLRFSSKKIVLFPVSVPPMFHLSRFINFLHDLLLHFSAPEECNQKSSESAIRSLLSQRTLVHGAFQTKPFDIHPSSSMGNSGFSKKKGCTATPLLNIIPEISKIFLISPRVG
jgi:hypothetical protein